ncbi:aminopeptidase [Citroniella saccharovorans]|uniref:M18 family aminopeptidase n=1 Tax=Citroniella saccharovorans TaxID=2053367 RepID=A0AAW9MXK1_9FIRM|nr:aminopeptidase [Citroniella saccharovorans]MEB3429155.1 aminopeptidase [Citroniella saccharovorans]
MDYKNVWQEVDKNEYDEIFAYSKKYMNFLDKGKTERLCTKEIIRIAKEKGFVELKSALENGPLKKGDKVYLNNKNKSAVLLVMGKNLLDGMKIVGSHIDSPRLDLKANPLYEEDNLALLKTHYYGGVKKYQWTAIPLAIHGIVFNKEGKEINVSIGDDEDDPVLYITDLLIHLSKDQMAKKLAEGISGEQLNVLIGHDSFKGKDSESDNKVKDNILKMIKDKYNFEEDDFKVAELEVVPAGKAKDVGLDRSMIAAHGHDDRVCSFASLEAILNAGENDTTLCSLFADKEEIGSVGNAGMDSYYLENMIASIFAASGDNAMYKARVCLSNSKVLSADVTVACDPSFPEVLEKKNACRFGGGVGLAKYTGSRGKGGSNDANAEFLHEVRNIFNKADVVWQTGELGKIDQGGGGTIAFILARYGAEVVDCGTAMLSMHAPIELVSKADAYMTYKAYKAFLEA